ncbi:MAG: RdgB/HAM1 family non-canonical purine NTP pyrophosphatase [Acidimicrobiales bacterium]
MASANPHKVIEIAQLLDGIEIVARPSMLGEVVEDGATLYENARLKALAVCEFAKLAAVADDTGLEVDALDGAPGVRSARYSGDEATDPENIARLLEALSSIEMAGERTARFRTVALVRFCDGRELRADGVVEGTIAFAPSGSGGFGYDPVFIPVDGDGRTFAEMSDVEKNSISHRGRAFAELARLLS